MLKSCGMQADSENWSLSAGKTTCLALFCGLAPEPDLATVDIVVFQFVLVFFRQTLSFIRTQDDFIPDAAGAFGLSDLRFYAGKGDIGLKYFRLFGYETSRTASGRGRGSSLHIRPLPLPCFSALPYIAIFPWAAPAGYCRQVFLPATGACRYGAAPAGYL